MDALDLNKLPEENDEGVQEDGLVPVQHSTSIQHGNVEINLNESPEEEGSPMPEEKEVILNESTWEIIRIFTAIYFPVVLNYLRR